MSNFFKKLLLGNVTQKNKPRFNPIERRLLNIKAIWNNDHQDDNGIEKIVRLLLSISQLFFPGVYIKYLADKIDFAYQDLAMDFYIIAKVIFPVIILKYNYQSYDWAIYILIYLLLETILYIPTLIFASDVFTRPRSYKRSMFMLFFNYIETICSFGVLYSLGNNLNQKVTHWYDYIYFSLVCSNSIGFGDFYPINLYGKVLASIQAMFFLSFVILFLNFFSKTIKSKGYFDNENES